ncbi:MAG TPA: hypothetical protein VE954_19910 [Oligoflexus sp.]|uniref:hypothetical protein n=1 Tax=Oligoflexus sp. TaxID=1971216 RepID=UPI002D3D8338|nr:hypothetical protein [Oligoflexus sp.]HYX35367.1 hypothetical protein [Oligoflexus sp.]
MLPQGFPITAESHSTRDRCLVGFLLFLLLLLPKLGVYDLSILPLALWFAVAGFRRRYSLKIVGWMDVLLLAWWILLGIGVCGYLYNGIYYAEILFKPARQIVLIVLLAALFQYVRVPFQTLGKAVIFAATVNGLIIFTQYILNLTHISSDFMIMPAFADYYIQSYRKPGLYAGYPVAGMMGVYGLIFSANVLRSKRSFFYASTLVICGFSILLTSRTAIIFEILAIILFVLPLFFSTSGRLIRFSALSIALVLGAAGLIKSGKLNQDTVNEMIHPFVKLAEGEVVAVPSVDALMGSYGNFPMKDSTWLVGNGLTMKTDEGVSVDDGFQVVLFGGGAIYLLILMLLPFLYFALPLRMRLSKYDKRALFFIYAMNFLSNAKGSYLFSRALGDVLVIITIYSICEASRTFARVQRMSDPIDAGMMTTSKIVS